MRAILVAIVPVLLAPVAGAQEKAGGEDAALKSEIRTLELESVTLLALRKLEIGDDQARPLWEAAKKAAGEKAALETRVKALREKQIEAFTRFRAEDMTNAGFTPKVERAAAAADHEEKELRKSFADRIGELEKEAPLTDAQRERLARFRPEDPRSLLEPRKDREATKEQRLHRELAEIHKEKVGAIEPVGRFLLLPSLVGALASRLQEKVESPTLTGVHLSVEEDSEIRGLRDDINLLNLMNGMNYSIHQLAHLAKVAEQADEFRQRESGEGVFDQENALRYRDLLNQIKGDLDRGIEPTRELLQTAWKMRLHVMKPARPRKDGAPWISKITAETKAILFPGQKEVLTDYNPCLIPPKNLKDPVRVGQSHESGPAIRALTTLRGVPESRWSDKRGEILEKTMARLEEAHGKFPTEEREVRKAAMGELLENVRELNDVDFELQKEDWAKEFAQFNRKEVLKQELDDLAGEEAVLNSKIRSFLLHPRAAALYRARLEQLRTASVGKPVDLDKISPADHCKDGHCAIKEK